ncbi:MAG TPA: efflux RND transporter periplasmic adaptor subunit [Polyangiales bacterium]
MVRYIVAILGLLLVVGGLAGIKASQISGLIEAGEAFAKAGPPPESVSSDVARELSWEGTLSAVGTIAAAKGVAVSNDSPGVVKRIAFESGQMAKAGQVLVELDTGVERAQLATAQARKELAEQNIQRTRSLFQSGGLSRSQLDADESALKGAQAEVAGLQAQIDRKVVRAPFTGRLGIRAINLGQYLSPGTPLTTLEALDSVYVDFTLPQQALSSVDIGFPVRVVIEGEKPVEKEGAVAAVDPTLDRATRSIRVRASIPNQDQKLRPGMFGNVSVVLPKQASIVAVPATAVVHAPYGDSIFLIEAEKAPGTPTAKDGKDAKDAKDGAPPQAGAGGGNVKQVRQQFVRLGEERGDFVAVLDGVKPGQEVVSSGAFKLRNGAKVVINNASRPNPQVDPRPENR